VSVLRAFLAFALSRTLPMALDWSVEIKLGGNTFLSTGSAKGRKPNKPRFNEFSSDSMR